MLGEPRRGPGSLSPRIIRFPVPFAAQRRHFPNAAGFQLFLEFKKHKGSCQVFYYISRLLAHDKWIQPSRCLARGEHVTNGCLMQIAASLEKTFYKH